MNWETVIGLEVHVQPATRSKMFCGCATSYGESPNTNVCPVCLGLPGALPTPNAEAVRLGVIGALALGCEIHPTSIFARKNYFYPDLPKGYQISQFDKPLATGGAVTVQSPDRGEITVSITRLHLEEDAGKSLHDRIPGFTAVDLNRAGTPLAEIVSGHDIRSPAEARAYLVTLRQMLVYAGVSECSMEKGSLRVDANLSVRRPGAPLGVKTEVKNMNSFANVERALEAERARQIALLEAGNAVTQVKPLRTKEDSHDYRYFPDPDLPPLILEPDWIETQRSALPELADAKRSRYVEALQLADATAGALLQEPDIARHFEELVTAGVDARVAASWALGEVIAGYNETGRIEVSVAHLHDLLDLSSQAAVSGSAAKTVYREMRVSKEPALAVATRLNLLQVHDTGALAGWVDEVVVAHPAEVARFRSGEAKLIGFFVGQVMKKSGGKADPKGIQPILLDRLKA
jgi:aspartyl-tRNA(Asn)/glutamyl-tRNA(Gln) amidotransferase subunit B